MLTFDEATHTYRWDGNLVPGVTSVLAPITDYSMVPRDVLEKASRFGKIVHHATALLDEGLLDPTSISPVVQPYLDAWTNFCIDHSCVWEDVEKPMYSIDMGFAGTPDRIGIIDDEEGVVDIKTTYQLMPSVGPQLAAYSHLKFGNKSTLKARWGVKLNEDGTYLAHRYHDGNDLATFASCLTLHRFCQRHKLTPSWSKK